MKEVEIGGITNFTLKKIMKQNILFFYLLFLLTLTFVGFKSVPQYSKNELIGKVDPTKNADFVLVDVKYASKSNMYLREETYLAFVEMFEAAQKEGIKIPIVSAFRSYEHQKSIWNRKWNGTLLVEGKNAATAFPNPVDRAQFILRYSALPGTSRHHWGTDIDILSVELEDYETPAAQKMYQWLNRNAVLYGFCQVYGTDATGHITEEKWHWSYMPLSMDLQKQYNQKIKSADLGQFSGSNLIDSLQVFEKVINTVKLRCTGKQ